MHGKEIENSLNDVIDTIHNPSDLATGDAIAVLVKKLVEKKPNLDPNEVVVLLQDAGFNSADGVKDFINMQIKLSKD